MAKQHQLLIVVPYFQQPQYTEQKHHLYQRQPI